MAEALSEHEPSTGQRAPAALRARPLTVVCDANIPLAEEVLEGVAGVVRRVPGRSLSRAALEGADVLWVRSVTRVDAALLEGTSVRSVGTATIGVDHVDQGALERLGVAFVSCPGSNAQAVAEYVATALLELAHRQGRPLRGRCLGVVGVGNVGRRVVRVAQALGMEVLCNDPPRAAREGEAGFVTLGALLERADIVTLHTPLTRVGPWPTHHRIGAAELERMKPDAALINSGRGAAVDGRALSEALAVGHPSAAVLDVWEGEPRLTPERVAQVALATPHIAGYAWDAKARATLRLSDALRRWLGRAPLGALEPSWTPEAPELLRVPERLVDAPAEEVARWATGQACALLRDDAALRGAIASERDAAARGAAFDGLRRAYPLRREFAQWRIARDGLSDDAARLLGALGWRCVTPPR